MRLRELQALLPPEQSARWHRPLGASQLDAPLRGIQYDSRGVVPGDLFVALRGSDVDGHRYIAEAARAGAIAVLAEEASESEVDIPALLVRDSRAALASLAAPFFGNPSEGLALIGITGTNGKTSTSVLCEAILRAAGREPGLIGTVEIRYANERFRSLNTTPESLEIQRTLRAMRNAGVDAVAMEVSSHGLSMGRVEGCRFDVAAISNVTQDHLDFHGDMRSYIEAKALLFERYLSKRGCAVVNVDDPVSERFIEGAAKTGSRIVRVSSRLGRSSEEAEVRCEEVQCALDHTQLRIATPRGTIGVNMKLIGGFNVENALLATGIGVALDLPGDRIASGLENCGQVPGRLERVEGQGPQDPRVFVDYAHTPDAVEKLLATLRPLTEGRLIAVFGCGGDRDRGKRPLMARAVAEHADLAIATSDNPRGEDPERILDDVEVGLEDLSRFDVTELATVESGYARVTDRRAAIAKAIAMAGPADTVVLAGKGHEDYQIIGRDRLPFDDREEARRALGVAAAAAAPR